MSEIIINKKIREPLFETGDSTKGCFIDTGIYTSPPVPDFIINPFNLFLVEEETHLDSTKNQDELWATMEEEVEQELSIGNRIEFETVDDAISFLDASPQ